MREYIDRGSGVISGDWAKQLENASARVHISRLDALKLELQAHTEELTGKRVAVTQKAAETAFHGSYYHTAYELQRVAGVGVSMQKIDRRRLEKVLSRPWTADGQTFTARCWNDKNKLVTLIGQELTRMTATGAKPDTAIQNIAHALNVSKSNAARVIMTESAFFASAAQKECFNDLNVERYEVVGTFDNRKCGYCGEMNGKVFPMKDFKEGTTAPPFHPWCRCCTAPYFEDMQDIGERWMRDPETGKGGYVPSDMTYREWKDIYVNKSSTMEEWTEKHTKTRKPLDKPTAGDNIGSSVHLFKQNSKDFPTIILPKAEYAHVMSEIATNLTEEQSKQPVFRKAIGNYYYSIENNGFGNYRIIRKESIE